MHDFVHCALDLVFFFFIDLVLDHLLYICNKIRCRYQNIVINTQVNIINALNHVL